MLFEDFVLPYRIFLYFCIRFGGRETVKEKLSAGKKETEDQNERRNEVLN